MPASAAEDDKTVDPLTNSAEVAETTPAVEAEKTPDVKSESSPAGETMLDAVKAAIKPKAETPSAETPEKPPAEATTPEPTEADDEDLSPDEVKQLGEKTQRRFRRLTSKINAKDAEIASLSPKAKELDDLNRYVREAGLSNEDVAGTLEIAAMLRHNPRGALDRLKPIIQALQSTLGEVLPPELQDRVKQNFISEEDAKVIARTTAEAKLSERRIAQLTEAQQQNRQQQETQEYVNGTIASASEWEAVKAKSDPDWQLKRSDVAKEVKLAIFEKAAELGRPWFPNKTEVVELNNAALKAVNARFAQFTPKPREIIPDGGSASSRSVAEPKSMLDVVRMAAG